MMKKLSMLSLAVAMVATSILVGCATSSPNSLTGNSRPIVNDKGMVVGYQAR